MDLQYVLVERLKAYQQEYALQALKMPSDKTEFEYGFKVGVLHGVSNAINEIIKTLREDDE